MQFTTILYRLVIACWLGGAALFTFILTPTLFRGLDRDLAGNIVGLLFPGYFRWGLACGAIALACLAITRGRHALASGVIIALMLAMTATQAFVIEPRAAALKKEIPSFVTTPPEHPQRQQFKKLHAISAIGNLGVIGGGVVLILLL
ncbi:MAG: hypothetical protein BWK76_06530 [Desulfobulbaceae bacterium A2]|nr:MAG: hypothetical protein BWK76_06530 [Desulfobulbaceae bacterium A2]